MAATKEAFSQPINDGVGNECPSPRKSQDSGTYSRCSLDKEAGLPTCRVCQCVESDKRGDAALGFLDIVPPKLELEVCKSNEAVKPENAEVEPRKDEGRKSSGLVEFVSPTGEVFICETDLEMGSYHQPDSLIELGCLCKNDLALVHYACALKWFVNHGSTVCEICGRVAKIIRMGDFKKVMVALKDYEALRERTVVEDPNPAQVNASSGVDPDAIAAIRRQRLCEVSLWFVPHSNSNYNHSAAVSQVVSEQPLNTVTGESVAPENPATKWAVEGTGILLATGLLTVTLAWLIAPRVGKIVLTRIKYGPARYWAILFVFWFLVFGIWASRTHGAHTT
ncbi:hypothetical protein Tsubulata_029727 [Turnera subulata]|uniref:RING-CH-type domain-containing protein n=1 Tax=Turnera subulata TaxID=218843 RepID=A0A9Q0JJT0_9ROSI|nr:hypothetical protein Tsubulata_029727 [Turnera subulata]